jgi:hypothetical protein
LEQQRKIMAITITPTLCSKIKLSEIIRNAFDNINFEMDYIYQEAPKLIKMARDYGLTELAEEMQNDL